MRQSEKLAADCSSNWVAHRARKRCGRQAQRSGDIIKRDGSKVFGLGELSRVVTGGAKRARPILVYFRGSVAREGA